MSSIGVAVIGADPTGRGFGARAHVPAVLALSELQLAAVCTSREETARAAAARWGAPRGYADYLDAVADERVELVTVAVRVARHLEVVEAALAAGKSVYCEWPLALDSDEALVLARSAEARDAAVAVGTQGRFAPAVAAARRILERGDIGRVLSFQASQLLPRFAVESGRAWLAREDEGSGALHVATAHVTDTIRFLLGPISSICGTRATLKPDDTFADTGASFTWTASDTVAYVARLSSGAVGAAHVANTATPAVGFSLRILGDEGQLLLVAPGYVSYTPARLLRARGLESEFEEVAFEQTTGIGVEASDPAFNVALALRALVTEDRAFRPDFDDAVALHRLLEAVARSSDEGVWITV